MATTRDASTYTDFDELMDRLTTLVSDVKAKDITIEQSLDLLEEGIALGLRATDIVEDPTFTAAEQEALAEAQGEENPEATVEEKSQDEVETFEEVEVDDPESNEDAS